MDRLEHIKWFRKEHPRSEHYPTDMKEKLAAFRRACRSGQAALAYVRAGQTSDGTCCTGRGSRLRQRPTRSPKASLGRWCSCRRSPAFDSVRLRLSAGPNLELPPLLATIRHPLRASTLSRRFPKFPESSQLAQPRPRDLEGRYPSPMSSPRCFPACGRPALTISCSQLPPDSLVQDPFQGSSLGAGREIRRAGTGAWVPRSPALLRRVDACPGQEQRPCRRGSAIPPSGPRWIPTGTSSAQWRTIRTGR